MLQQISAYLLCASLCAWRWNSTVSRNMPESFPPRASSLVRETDIYQGVQTEGTLGCYREPHCMLGSGSWWWLSWGLKEWSTSGFKGWSSWGGDDALQAEETEGLQPIEERVWHFSGRGKAREPGAEKARASTVQEEPRELGRERVGWILLAVYGIFVFIARILPDFDGS